MAGSFCERTLKDNLGLEVEWQDAGFLQLGTTSKYTNNDGLLLVWGNTAGKKEIKCTSSLNAKEIRYLGVDGENLTKLVKLEERE